MKNEGPEWASPITIVCMNICSNICHLHGVIGGALPHIIDDPIFEPFSGSIGLSSVVQGLSTLFSGLSCLQDVM